MILFPDMKLPSIAVDAVEATIRTQSVGGDFSKYAVQQLLTKQPENLSVFTGKEVY